MTVGITDVVTNTADLWDGLWRSVLVSNLYKAVAFEVFTVLASSAYDLTCDNAFVWLDIWNGVGWHDYPLYSLAAVIGQVVEIFKASVYVFGLFAFHTANDVDRH